MTRKNRQTTINFVTWWTWIQNVIHLWSIHPWRNNQKSNFIQFGTWCVTWFTKCTNCNLIQCIGIVDIVFQNRPEGASLWYREDTTSFIHQNGRMPLRAAYGSNTFIMSDEWIVTTYTMATTYRVEQSGIREKAGGFRDGLLFY